MDIWIILQKIILNQIDQESRHKMVITLETKLIEDLKGVWSGFYRFRGFSG